MVLPLGYPAKPFEPSLDANNDLTICLHHQSPPESGTRNIFWLLSLGSTHPRRHVKFVSSAWRPPKTFLASGRHWTNWPKWAI